METLIPIKDALRLVARGYKEKSIRVAEVECLVTDYFSYQVVIPRGTEFGGFFSDGGWLDVLRDIRTFPWYSRKLGGCSHSGFYKGARGIVYKGLFGLLRREKPILFLGHSLGGALALNAAALLEKEGFEVAGVITFGSPRTFTRGLAKKINRKRNYPVWQFKNPEDTITKLPLKWWGFAHLNPMLTDREPKGKGFIDGIKCNHMLPHYMEAFEDV